MAGDFCIVLLPSGGFLSHALKRLTHHAMINRKFLRSNVLVRSVAKCVPHQLDWLVMLINNITLSHLSTNMFFRMRVLYVVLPLQRSNKQRDIYDEVFQEFVQQIVERDITILSFPNILFVQNESSNFQTLQQHLATHLQEIRDLCAQDVEVRSALGERR